MGSLTIGWLQGSVVSASALHQGLVECALGPHEETIARTVRRCRTVYRHASLRVGPASGATAVWRLLAGPLVELLRWQVCGVATHQIGAVATQVARLGGATGRTALVVTLPWGMQPGPVARSASRLALESGVRWTMVTNGLAWRWLDTHRPLGRQHVELHLPAALADERVWEAMWLMGQADVDRLDQLARLTVALEAGATRAIREAVADVRQRLAEHLRASDEEVLTQVFRWLFLLFAEARDLLPMHNPVYRQAYAVTTMAQHARKGRAPFSLWDGLRASALLAHTGSAHPLLPVTALNGALFEPESTPLSRRRRLPDRVIGPMLEALTTVSRREQRRPVSFADLDVEHLGTIYEDVLAGRRPPASGGDTAAPASFLIRKQTGTFYTPRDLADHLVAETLAPLVEGRSVEQILALRLVDPAAGSGAILASAARFLLSAIEAAWLRDGRGGPLDVPARERADAIRRIVEQCLYGVDVHGRAVQVARLSLWLVSMTRERPLTFLDHHLRVGNSLIGASPAEIVTRRPGRARRAGVDDRQPALFDLDEWDRRAGDLALAFTDLTAAESDSADAVRAKARRFRTLHDDMTLQRWRRRADLWCGAWMHETDVSDGVWAEVDRMARGRPASTATASLAALAATFEQHARDAHCFHWAIEFPEIFRARDSPGFDAVLANPPWEVLRADLGSADARVAARASVARQQRFVTRSGLYSPGTTGHRNLYQLFVERMLQLCSDGGRIGVIAPWGLMADHASAATRRTLLGRAAADRVTVFENRRRIFPIHRSVRFVSLTATAGAATTGLTLRTAVDSVDARPRRGATGQDVWLDVPLLQAADRHGLSMPCLRSGDDLPLLRAILTRGQPLEQPPWRLSFGRELNASDDRGLLRDASTATGALPVVGGRDLRPFGLEPARSGTVIAEDSAVRRLPAGGWRRWRLGYRDVAAATNRLSLIAALVPPRVLTTHTVFVLRQPLPLRDQLYLCAVLNSLVANWFVRLYMGTHVTAALLGRLPVPVPGQAGPAARRVAWLVTRLRRAMPVPLEASSEYVELQVMVAGLYGLSPEQFATVVETFPGLLPGARRLMVDSLAERRLAGAISGC